MRFWLKMEVISSPFRTQSDFARALGKSDDWLSKIILGRKDPTDEEKKLIASVLKINLHGHIFFNTE